MKEATKVMAPPECLENRVLDLTDKEHLAEINKIRMDKSRLEPGEGEIPYATMRIFLCHAKEGVETTSWRTALTYETEEFLQDEEVQQVLHSHVCENLAEYQSVRVLSLMGLGKAGVTEKTQLN